MRRRIMITINYYLKEEKDIYNNQSLSKEGAEY